MISVPFSLSRFRRENQFDSSRIDPSIARGIVEAVQLAWLERGEKEGGRRLIRLGNFRVVGLHFVSAAINPASWISLSFSLFLSLVSAFAFTLNAISLSRPTTSSKIFLSVSPTSDPSFFHVLFNETSSPTIEYPTVKMLFIIEHSASTFYVSFPPSNVQPLLSNNNSFLQSNAPFMKFITSFHLTSLFFFLPHFSAN